MLVQLPIEIPTDWATGPVFAWIVSLLLFLAGGGALTKVFLSRQQSFNARERESWDRIKGQLQEQSVTIAEQEAKIERLHGKAEEYYSKMDELRRGLFDEKEAGAQGRALFTHLSRSFEDCQQDHERKVAHIGELAAKVAECEQRDAARAAKLVEVEHALDELRQRMPGPR